MKALLNVSVLAIIGSAYLDDVTRRRSLALMPQQLRDAGTPLRRSPYFAVPV